MKRKIPCFCDNIFEVDVPEEIDLDSNTEYLTQIQDGTFLNFTCPSCRKKHKPEFPLSVLWPSKNIRFEVFPELERGEFYRRKTPPGTKKNDAAQTIIGYPELADRLAVIRDGFEPAAVEAIKYFLHLKAEEQYPDDDIDIWYSGSAGSEGSLQFHIHGIRKDEVAVMKVPLSVYQKTLADYNKHPESDTFSSLRVRTYLSVKNTMRPEELK
ncbi:MAG: CpXC domain-containing protein [Treponema sp.]|nr:CpXC domain-containing protein [Treponema sp.]